MKSSIFLNLTQALRQKAFAPFPCAGEAKCLVVGFIFACSTLPASAQLSKKVDLYHWIDFSIEAPKAATGIVKWDVEGSCMWTHENGAIERTSLLWYSGLGDTYVCRFGGSFPQLARWLQWRPEQADHNRYIAARLGPLPGWSMGIGWDVEFWVNRAKLEWWLDDLIPQLDGWHHWIGHRYSDSDIGQGRDPDPANKGNYLSRGITWNTLRSGEEQYAGWEHWSTSTSDSAIDTGLVVVPDRPMMSEDRFRRRDNVWPQKDMHSDDDILKEIPRWAERGVAAMCGGLIDSNNNGSDIWPNRTAIKAVIEGIDE